MEIAKAIEILCDLQAGIIPPDQHDMFDALALGERACKRILFMREKHTPEAWVRLRGEGETVRYAPDVRD